MSPPTTISTGEEASGGPASEESSERVQSVSGVAALQAS